MGRFNDLWLSGKFAVKRNQEADESRMLEARARAQELAPDMAINPDSKEIFNALKAKRGQETGRWLSGLVPANVEKPIEVQAAAATAFEDVNKWIDLLCEQFVELAYEFNKKAVGTNLYISYEKPKLFEKRDEDVWYRPVDKTYKCRLTTRDWALIVRGHDSKIAVFVVPSSMVMAFDNESIGEDEMPHLMEIERTAASGGTITWMIGGEATSLSSISPLAKELFGDLIRVSSGVMTEAELFSTDKGPTLGENVAVGYQQPADGPSKVSGSTQGAPQGSATESVSSTPARSSEHVISKACDIVDEIIDQELKNLYASAAQIQPGTPEASGIRRQISATETFHTKILDAFKDYTQATLSADNEKAAGSAPSAMQSLFK
ncbi:hypothetical protein KBI23_12690 [bacterium]|nr:hypothetical protein [bacterium]MBP9807816.1 hypothetical protein [bacterium]